MPKGSSEAHPLAVTVLPVMPNITLASGPPWVEVFTEYVNVHVCGDRAHRVVDRVRVHPDAAGDLADRLVAWVKPIAGDETGVTMWLVGAMGFTEHEAHEALEAALRQLENRDA